MRAATIALLAVLLGLGASVAVGLFAGREHPRATLSSQDAVRLAAFERDVRASVSLDDRISGPTYGQLLAASDLAIALFRAKPDAIYRSRAGRGPRTVRQVLAAAAFRLAPYEPDLTTKLVRAVEASP